MDDLLERIWEQKFVFAGTFFVIFTLTYIVCVAFDFLPEPPAVKTNTEVEIGDIPIEERPVDEVKQQDEVVQQNEVQQQDEVEQDERAPTDGKENAKKQLPISISIPKLGKIIPVLNPASRSVADLDAGLLEGVVRHPDSATLAQEGNVFILGHSSYLPQVFNKNFQAFNGIQDLEWGDTIEVQTEDTTYHYRVERVYRATAQDLTVPIAGTGKILTLATCNSFGSVDDRYIVEARQLPR